MNHRPSRPTVPLDGKRIIDSYQFLKGEALPRDLIVVGAGVSGLDTPPWSRP
jgi:pyruvate/2-oxoglutarate dehydrogenase complex dihydrolipoamide dehydrogenase (E3) component